VAGLIVTNVAKEFATRGDPLAVLSDVSFTLAAGEKLAVLGPSGSGKSTLLHIVGTLLPATSGEVELDGQRIASLDPRELARFRNRQIGFVFQDHHLLPQCSAVENVLIPMLADGRTNSTAVERAKMLLDRVGLGDRLTHRPAELSGGQRQRVAVARALIREPALLLADEPTGNLDRASAAGVVELLLEMVEQAGMMLVAVTHSLDVAKRFDRRAELEDGRLRDAE